MSYEAPSISDEDVVDINSPMPDLENRTISEVLKHVSDHLSLHLRNLQKGFYDQLYPPEVVSALIIINQSQLDELLCGDLGELSPSALLARFYACMNEENDFLMHIRESMQTQL